MRKLKDLFWNYFKKDTEIDITLFKILGIAGALVSVISGTQSIVLGVSLVGGLIDYVAAILSILLLWYVDKTGRYVHGYIITTVVVFMGLFTMLFFEMGGLDGSMPYFFAFSLVFSFLMFRGKLLIFMEILETIFYVGVCWFSYIHPEYVKQFETERDMFLDRVVGFVLVGLGIGLIFLAYIGQYRKQKEIAEEASKAKSQFLANMSHEIRTPINMMMGMVEMIRREAEHESIKEYAANAGAAGKQLMFEVNQVLQFSRLDAGKEGLLEETYNFPEMLNNLKAFFEKEASAKGLDFLMKYEGTMPTALQGDMRKLLQILTNLLSNAIKYTSQGNVIFTIRNAGMVEDSIQLYFSVEDTGIGIRENELESIFTSFERADLSKNRDIEGTGLGLAIASNLAKMFGTSIQVRSEYGKGSCFYLTVLQKLGDAADLAKDEETKGSFIAPDAKILVVDDNKMNISVVKSLLKKNMVHIVTAGDAKECYRVFEKEKPDLVLMDYMMPEIDGIEAMKQLRLMTGQVRTPIIVLTADVSPSKREMFVTEGFDSYLYKPIDWRELERCLMAYLPEQLVTPIQDLASGEFSREEIKEYTELVKPYDINLAEGLRYVGGDLRQYARIADYFVNNTKEGIEKLKGMSGQNSELTLIFHSLKGNARNVGAVELHYMAKRLEKRCRAEDMEYIASAINLAIFEWNRVQEGLACFLREFRASSKAEKVEDTVRAVVPKDKKEEMIRRILAYIESNRQTPAVKLLDELLAGETDPGWVKSLTEARKKISEIEFEEAETIIKGLL